MYTTCMRQVVDFGPFYNKLSMEGRELDRTAPLLIFFNLPLFPPKSGLVVNVSA
jgi:hypothetical protein